MRRREILRAYTARLHAERILFGGQSVKCMLKIGVGRKERWKGYFQMKWKDKRQGTFSRPSLDEGRKPSCKEEDVEDSMGSVGFRDT
jgi:hypothetical protein